MGQHRDHPNHSFFRSRLPVLFLIFFFLGIYTTTVWACTCPGLPPGPVEMFKKSDVVFLGTGIKAGNSAAIPVTFRVEKVWKGISDAQVILHLGTMCADSVGYGSYLIFAHKSKRDGKLYQIGCSYARPVENMDVEFQILDLIAKGFKEKKIYEEILNIAKLHKDINHRVQAVKLIMRIQRKNLENLPKDTDETLKKLAKNPDSELSRSARRALVYLRARRY
jgi:hypothetical protein